MGLLKDTYVVNKIDTSNIAYQMKRKNDIQEHQNLIINKTKDRVNISLNEYEDLKSELKKSKELIANYESFIKSLANHIGQDHYILLKSKIAKSEIEKAPLINGYNLYVIFQIGNETLGGN